MLTTLIQAPPTRQSLGAAASGANADISSMIAVTGGITLGASTWLYWSGRSIIYSSSDGVLRFQNTAETDFNRIQLGGTTSSFPAIKRNGTGIDLRLADDSAYANLTCNNVILNGIARLKGYTVATLPAGTQGDVAFVTDALAPSFLVTIAGGGAVITPVFYNGTTWVAA